MKVIKPGFFGKTIPTDERRLEFDFANEQLLYMKKKPDILFIGDSITQLWDLNVFFNTEKLLINRGIGGDTSKYLLKRFDADVIQLNPSLAIVMIGTNDITATHYDPWWRISGLDEEDVFIEATKNINKMVNKCLENSINIALCSIIPSYIAAPYNKHIRWKLTERINDFIIKLSQDKNIKYIDYHSSLCMKDGKTIITDLSPDGIHVNAKGYEIMAKTLKKMIDL
ncbi:MAG: hypothetical protein KAQ69_12120 [Spirochaetales bacterium]|nr:hypothetical protein [Spirochaetales bacterium]